MYSVNWEYDLSYDRLQRFIQESQVSVIPFEPNLDHAVFALQSLHSTPWHLPLPYNCGRYKEAAPNSTHMERPMTWELAS